MSLPHRPYILIIAIALWLGGVTFGIKQLWNYQNTPGEEGRSPRQWPVQSFIPAPSTLPTLILLAHPQCPCTRATIEELTILMTRLHGQLNAHVLFYAPDGFPDGWEKSDLWRAAVAIPDVHVWSDRNGKQLALFGASTSGQTLVYDRHGRLLFSGGITAARGHIGDNPGRTAIVSWLTTTTGSVNTTQVFGCPLSNKKSEKPLWKN